MQRRTCDAQHFLREHDGKNPFHSITNGINAYTQQKKQLMESHKKTKTFFTTLLLYIVESIFFGLCSHSFISFLLPSSMVFFWTSLWHATSHSHFHFLSVPFTPLFDLMGSKCGWTSITKLSNNIFVNCFECAYFHEHTHTHTSAHAQIIILFTIFSSV